MYPTTPSHSGGSCVTFLSQVGKPPAALGPGTKGSGRAGKEAGRVGKVSEKPVSHSDWGARTAPLPLTCKVQHARPEVQWGNIFFLQCACQVLNAATAFVW